MAQHGYLREFDEGPDRDDRDRDWSEPGRERSWRDSDRGFMFDRGRSADDDDRGFIDRMGDRARSWFRDDDRQYRGAHEDDWRSGGQDQGGGFARGGSGSRPAFSSRQDDHYRSWRDRQIEALDRDYADYCREREQQFHSDFDNWRRSRQQGASQLQGRSEDGKGEMAELELTPDRAIGEKGNAPSPAGQATLGTNNSENTATGRR